MKPFRRALVLSLLLLFFFASCDGGGGDSLPVFGEDTAPQSTGGTGSETTSSASQSASVPSEPTEQGVPFTVEDMSYAEQFPIGSAGRLILGLTIALPKASGGAEGAAAAVNAYAERLLEEEKSASEAYVAELEPDVADSVGLNYSRSTSYEVTANDGAIFSYKVTTELYSGGIHGDTKVYGVNLRARDGAPLALSDLMEGGNEGAAKALLSAAVGEVEKLAASDPVRYGFYDNYRDTVLAKYDAGTLDGAWYVDGEKKAITVVFSLYEIGPYSTGIVEASVPFSSLPMK